MSELADPGRDARKAAKRQAEEIRKQKQKTLLEKAEAEDISARKKSLAMNPNKGRRGLIGGLLKDTLG